MILDILLGFVLLAISGGAKIPVSTSTRFPPINENAMHNVSSGLNQFATEFHKILAKNQSGNFVCSPLSLSMVLSMASDGARGKTGRDLRKALHLPQNREITRKGFRSLIDTLNNIRDVELRSANGIFVDSSIHLKEKFVDRIRETFRSSITTVDFGKAKKSAETINTWCDEKTNHQIRDVIVSDSLKDISLILINAVYFKGTWDQTFDPKYTKPRPFLIDYKNLENVPTMFNEETFNHGLIEKYKTKFVELPYQSKNQEGAFSVFVFMPDDEKHMKQFEAELHRIDFTQLETTNSFITLQIPKFKIKSTLMLKEILTKMGLKSIFRSSDDFHGISGDSRVRVSKVIQHVFFEVDEKGSEAAAVTQMGIATRMLPESLKISKPFVAVIISKGTGAILFTARINNPTIGSSV